MRFAYADPPYVGQCRSYGHFHNDNGQQPWDGLCWDERDTQKILLGWLSSEMDGFAYSCNPADLPSVAGFGRVAAWCKTWHQIRPTSTQFSWEPVIFKPGRSDPMRTMVRDWLKSPVAKGTGQRGAKPDAFNDWILDLICYTSGDEFIDLFPGSYSMGRALERHQRRLR